jgi:predicted TIM-barrel fold metal-dependent hydrolase
MTTVEDIVDANARIVVDAPAGGFGSAEDVLHKMDINGIAQAVIAPHPAYETPLGVASSAAQNDAIRVILDRWPDRFPAGLGVVEPRHGARARPEAARAIRDLGLRGFAFDNDVSGLPIDSPSLTPLLEEVADVAGLVMQFVTTPYSVLRTSFRLAAVALRFPQMAFVSQNAFVDITHEAASADLAGRCTNVWFDLARAKSQLSTVEQGVAALGVGRILFGSALPDTGRSLTLEMVRIARLEADDRAAILAGNARRLFGLRGAA